MSHLTHYRAEVAHAVNEQLAGDVRFIALKLKSNAVRVDPHGLGQCFFQHFASSCFKLVSHL